MEGISHEASSLAGVLGLDKLVVLYDDNNISIDGEVGGWFGDDTPARFEAYGWNVVRNVDGHKPEAIKQALDIARASRGKRSEEHKSELQSLMRSSYAVFCLKK